MDMSNHPRLYVERPAAAVRPGLIQWIMLPFAVLHRHNWSAPWLFEAAPAARCLPDA